MSRPGSESSTSTLIHGIEVCSKRLKYCLSPMSLMYQFTGRSPNRPKPLTLMVVSMIACTIMTLIIMQFIAKSSITRLPVNIDGFLQAFESVFFMRFFRFYQIFRIITYILIIAVTIYYHGSIANVMAQNNNIISLKEQSYIGKVSFSVFLFKSISSSVSILFLSRSLKLPLAINTTMCLLYFIITFVELAPIMFTCYLGAALGKHVENFSEQHIDTLFDQCFKAKDMDEFSNSLARTNSIPELDDEDIGNDQNCCWRSCYCLCSTYKFIKKMFRKFWRFLRDIVHLLNSRRYPELPEMKMTKISSKIKITDQMRITNTHLIRIRLRRTQIMLNELRDTVSDINKMSSPIIMFKLFQECLFLTLIATGSIQGKMYKSVNIEIIPTITETLSLIAGVVYICNCLDDTTSQLKLMINKLFDFIIMNHRVDKEESERRDSLYSLSGSSMAYLSNHKEDDSLSETWSQFQYTRKLANTIQFTMGGILLASRRLVLPILGHILSAVFISIEIMSIVDTSKDPNVHSNHHANHADNLAEVQMYRNI